MASIDGEFTDDEQGQILSLIRDQFQLSDDDVQATIAAAREEVDRGTDIWRLSKDVRDHCSKDEQRQIVAGLWRIMYADGYLDSHEVYLINKIGDLLHLSHDELIAVKQSVLQEQVQK